MRGLFWPNNFQGNTGGGGTPLTLFGQAYFYVSGTGGGGGALNIFGLGRVRVPILFGNYFPRSDLPYTKGFMKFGCPQPSKTVFDF